MHNKNTKIVCTLGPASDSVPEITRLIQAGMNVARLNFSHGDHKDHARIIKNLRKAEKNTGKTVGLLQDLQGPKIRIGEMPKKGIKIEQGKLVTVTTEKIIGFQKNGKVTIPIGYKDLLKDVKTGDAILINDGLIELQITKKYKNQLTCKVKTEGLIKTRQGINLPTASISKKTITLKDKKDLEFGLRHNVDFVALSFVKSKKDINDLRKLIEKAGKDTPIIAKIERHEAVTNLTEIIRASDGVMVARGDLGVDIEPERVPIVQKQIIRLANKHAKPVITATQVLYTMVKKARPTRAEISDAANAVFDHTDAIMLSNETAVGKYPARATTTLTKVAHIVEEELRKNEEVLENMFRKSYHSTLNATCLNACELAVQTKADFIVVYTEDGYTARQIAKHRLYIPIITITPQLKISRRLSLVWGLNKVFTAKIPKSSLRKPEKIIEYLKKEKVIKKNQKIVIVCNASHNEKSISTFKI